MNENNRNEKVSGEIGTNRKSTVKHKGKTVKKIIKKRSRNRRAKKRRSKQRMQMRGENITEMIASITIIISMCCWQ